MTTKGVRFSKLPPGQPYSTVKISTFAAPSYRITPGIIKPQDRKRHFGKVCKRVTLFEYGQDFQSFSTGEVADYLYFKKKCLIGLTGLHSLIWLCLQ